MTQKQMVITALKKLRNSVWGYEDLSDKVFSLYSQTLPMPTLRRLVGELRSGFWTDYRKPRKIILDVTERTNKKPHFPNERFYKVAKVVNL